MCLLLLHYVTVKHYAKSAANPATLLAGKVRRILSEGHSGVVRVEVPAAGANPLGWLRQQRELPRIYWSGRDGELEIAAAGVADSRGDAGLLPDLSDPDIRYYGGMAFDPGQSSQEWSTFGSSEFFLPRLELRREGDSSVLSCNLFLPQDAGCEDEILELIEGTQITPSPIEEESPSPLLRSESPDFEGWRRAMGGAFSSFEKEGLKKVVLARRVDLHFAGEIDAPLLLENLKTLTPDSFHFYFEPQGGAAFLGASPELLFYRRGSEVWSEAVAGTRPRGESAEEDDRLRDDLLGSEKDLREQRYVRSAIEEALEGLCEELEISEVSEMRLARRRHLVSPVRGTLREGVTDPEILSALHPTPAAGGSPKEEAVNLIRELETFDRGWYAGPVGWIGRDEAEFAVGIRSALAIGDKLSLYSGAGIVPGSDPLSEWEEIEQKVAEFEKILGIVS